MRVVTALCVGCCSHSMWLLRVAAAHSEDVHVVSFLNEKAAKEHVVLKFRQLLELEDVEKRELSKALGDDTIHPAKYVRRRVSLHVAFAGVTIFTSEKQVWLAWLFVSSTVV